MAVSTTSGQKYLGWLLLVPPDANEHLEWEFLEFETEEAARDYAYHKKLEDYDRPHYILSKHNAARLIEDFCAMPTTSEKILEKYGAEKKAIIDKQIKEVIDDTFDAEDAKQYVDDIVYDIENEFKETLPESDEADLKEYINAEIDRLHDDE